MLLRKLCLTKALLCQIINASYDKGIIPLLALDGVDADYISAIKSVAEQSGTVCLDIKNAENKGLFIAEKMAAMLLSISIYYNS